MPRGPPSSAAMFAVVEKGERFLNVELGRHAVVEAHLREVRGLLLERDVLARDGQRLLERPDVDVERGHVARQRDEDVVVVGDRGGEVRLGRLEETGLVAPDIELPLRVEAEFRGLEGRVDVEDALRVTDRSEVLADARLRERAARDLGLRVELAEGDAELGAGPEDPRAGGLERQVLGVGPRDEVVQDGIVEGGPPLDHGGAARGQTACPARGRGVGVEPGLDHRRCGGGEVRPHGVTGGEEPEGRRRDGDPPRPALEAPGHAVRLRGRGRGGDGGTRAPGAANVGERFAARWAVIQSNLVPLSCR